MKIDTGRRGENTSLANMKNRRGSNESTETKN